MTMGLRASADGSTVDLLLGATLIASFSTAGIENVGTLLANAAEAQGLTATKKLLTPAMLASAFQGANRSLSASGYQVLPGGLIIQWVNLPQILAGAGYDFTWPIAFTAAVLGMSAIPVTSAEANDIYLTLRSLNGLVGGRIANGGANTADATSRIIAIGY
jgi:hypothetical protein